MCLAPRVPLPSRLFQGPQSSPALQGRGVGTGSRVHTLTGLQGEPRFPPPGGAGHARCPCLCSGPKGPGSGQRLLRSSACDGAGGHTGAAETNVLLFSCSVVSDSAIPRTAAFQASLSITNSRNLLKLMSIESVMPSNHLILCRPLLLLCSIFPSNRVLSRVSSLHQVARVLALQLQHQFFQ